MTEKFDTNRILVSGTGKMGKPLLNGIDQDKRYKLLPWAISDDVGSFIQVGTEEIGLIPLEERAYMIPNIWNDRGPFILVDAVPGPVSQGNAEFYSQFDSIPVIMMSTGEKDLSKIRNTLILPNACLQLIAWEKFVAGLEENMFADGHYSLKVLESHQASKIDVSGTARKMLPKFNRLGFMFEEDQIQSIRDEEGYLKIGIPFDFHKAHGFHCYTITSSKKDDGFLKVFFGQIVDYFAENSLFKNLFSLDPKPISDEKYCEKSFIWGNDLVDPLAYRTFSFGLKLVLTETQTKIKIFHTILGHEPYVQGILNNAIPFMQEKCRNGLTGENFTSLDLYDWAMNR